MKSNEHERTTPEVAGLTSSVQQAEMKLLLAGRWPPLKPLPIFKYETDEYRASIEFDKTRGEWACRKISLPANRVQELRGGLTEIVMALPHGQAKVFVESAAAEQQEQESEKDASRRFQAILEWREKYENGAMYSGLQEFLCESQKDEIDDSIRLTLTARQLQFSPKNVAYVFEALSKAGGRLATLIEIATRKKTEQGTKAPASAEAAAPGDKSEVSVGGIYPTHERRLQKRTTPGFRADFELGGTNGGTVLDISETGMAVAVTDPLLADDYLPSIRIQPASSWQCIQVSAQIVWLAESRKRGGMRFVELTAESRNQISNWIASEKPVPEFEDITQAPIESLIPKTLERFAEGPNGSACVEPEHNFSPELIVNTASQTSKIVMSEILDVNPPSFTEDIQEKVPPHAPVTGFGPQVRASRVRSSAGRAENDSSRSRVLEISGFQVAAFALVVLFAVCGLTVGLTAGRGPLGRLLQDAWRAIPAVDTTSPALSNRPGESTSQASTSLAANTSNTSGVNPSAPEAEESRSESPSTQTLKGLPEDTATYVSPSGLGSTMARRPLMDSDRSAGANKLDEGLPLEKGSHESAPDSESFANAASADSNLPPTTEAKPSVDTVRTTGRTGPTGLIGRNASSHASPKSAHSLRAIGPISEAPRNRAPHGVTPVMGAAPHPSPPSTILVTAPPYGGKPFRVTFPGKPIAATSSFAMTSELSVLIPPQPGGSVGHKPARLEAGELVSFVWPRYAGPGSRNGSAETVKVRTTIGQLGQVLDTKLVNGSPSLFPAVRRAMRLWRYKPTLLNKKPVQVQQDITIQFRPPLYLSQLRPLHPSHK